MPDVVDVAGVIKMLFPHFLVKKDVVEHSYREFVKDVLHLY